MHTTIIKTKSAQPMGEYRPTEIDAAKAAADFRVLDVSGSRNFIAWKDGRSEYVTDRRLVQLQSRYTWAPDF